MAAARIGLNSACGARPVLGCRGPRRRMGRIRIGPAAQPGTRRAPLRLRLGTMAQAIAVYRPPSGLRLDCAASRFGCGLWAKENTPFGTIPPRLVRWGEHSHAHHSAQPRWKGGGTCGREPKRPVDKYGTGTPCQHGPTLHRWFGCLNHHEPDCEDNAGSAAWPGQWATGKLLSRVSRALFNSDAAGERGERGIEGGAEAALRPRVTR
jgi:hypothetical protein